MVISSTFGMGYSMILDNQIRSIENSKEIEKRYVPIYESLPKFYNHLEKLDNVIHENKENILILCITLEAPCK